MAVKAKTPGPSAESENPLSEAVRLYESGDYLEALSRIPKTMQNDPVATDLLSNIYMSLGKYEEALKANETALRLNPDESSLWTNKANILVNLGRYEEALEANERALGLSPNDPNIWINQAGILTSLGQYERANEANEKALSANEEELKRSDNHPSVLSQRAEILINLGQYEEALRVNNEALEKNEKDISILSRHVYILMTLGHWEEALSFTNRLLDLSPSDIDAIEYRISILKNLKKYDEALNTCEWALSVMPSDTFALMERANILVIQGDYKTALESNEKALKIDPTDEGLIFQNRKILDIINRPEQKEKNIESFLEEEGQKPVESKRTRQKQQKRIGLLTFAIKSRAISDTATDKDLLGFSPLAEGIDALLNNKDTRLPMTIALTAPWGGGKSSLMRQLEASLRRPEAKEPAVNSFRRHWHTVNFEAWKYDSCERLWAIMAKSIYEKVQSPDQMSFFERIAFKFKLECARLGPNIFTFRGLGIPALVAVIAALLAVFLGQVQNLITDWAVTAGAIGGVAAALIVAWAAKFWGLIGDPFKQSLKDYCAKYKYEEHLGFTEEASQDISKMIRILTAKENHALAVFVDDLDRCSPKHIVEIIESINQIFNASDNHRCVFILGIDREAVAASIEAHYDELVKRLKQLSDPTAEDFGLRFLSKIVQLSVAIPLAHRDKMKNLIASDSSKIQREKTTPEPPADMVQNLRQRIREEKPLNPIDVERIGRKIEEEKSLGDTARSALTRVVREMRAEYFTTDSPDIFDVECKLLNYLDRNPRQVKRFDNAFRLQLMVASESAGDQLTFDSNVLFALGKWVALRLRWPRLASDIDRERNVMGRDLLKELEAYANMSASKKNSKLRDEYKRWFDDPFLKLLLKVEKEDDMRITSIPWESVLRIT